MGHLIEYFNKGYKFYSTFITAKYMLLNFLSPGFDNKKATSSGFFIEWINELACISFSSVS